VLQDQSSSSFSFGHDLIRHNLVVFRAGEGALQVLPSLVDVIPEARLNLVIYYLKQVRFVDLYGPFSRWLFNTHTCWQRSGLLLCYKTEGHGFEA
jgi:hypothetical protein